MATWIQLESSGGATHRCVLHSADFSMPAGCPECATSPDDGSIEQEAPLPFLPGMPTPVEDERKLREFADWCFERAKEPVRDSEDPGKDNGRAKYAEIGLRAFVAARDMGERRVDDWNDERRQLEIKSLGGTPRAKRK